MQAKTEKIWCVVPAAGIGTRMQAGIPKQYLKLNTITILDFTLGRLLSNEQIEKVVVCIHPEDDYWQDSIFANHSKVIMAAGGNERADTVLNGIHCLQQHAASNDWVLVHDAARPCVRVADIKKLIDKAIETQVGAILVAPLHDTIKQAEDGFSTRTLDRSVLWRALTPQLFKIEELQLALMSAKNTKAEVTDEASAIEQMSKPVQLVEGHADNIKITSPADLNLARYYLAQQEKKTCG